MNSRKSALLVGFVSILMIPPTVLAQATQAKASPTHSEAAAMLKQDMRKLWTDHVVWTRDYIIAATEKQPDAPSALSRLMKNQDDIGSAVAKYYGDVAGRQLTTLLKDHIAIAGDIVKAAMAGDKAGVEGCGRSVAPECDTARRLPQQSQSELAPSDAS